MEKKQMPEQVKFILPIAWLIGTLSWILVFSDFSKKGTISKNDVVNIVFIVFFGIVVFYALKKLTSIFNVRQCMVDAAERLNNNSTVSDTEMLEIFSDVQSNVLYQEYVSDRKRSLDSTYDDFVKSDINDFINLDNYAEYFSLNILEQISGTLTGLGMLGTFIGLSFGLANFEFLDDSAKIAEKIIPLMSCIQLAFITSIFGLVLSIIFNFIYKHSIDELEKSIKTFGMVFNRRQGKSINDDINAILNGQNEQLDVLKTFGENVSKEISNTIETEYERMQKTYLDACKLLGESHEKALELMVNQFTEKVFGAITRVTERLTDSVTEAVEIQNDSVSRIKANIEAINGLSDNTTKIHELSVQTVDKLKEYTDNLDVNTNNMLAQVEKNNSAMIEAQKRLESFSAVAGQLEKTATELFDTFNNLQEYKEEIEEKYDSQLTQLTDTGNKLQEAIVCAITTAVSNSKNEIENSQRISQQQLGEIQKIGNDTINAVNNSITDYTNNTKMLITEINLQSENSVKTLNDENEKAIASFKSTINNYSTRIDDSSKNISEKMDEFNKTSKTVSNTMNLLKESSEKLNSSVDDYNRQIKDATDSAAKKISELNQSLDSVRKDVDAIKRTTNGQES